MDEKKVGVKRDGSPYSDEECEKIIEQLAELLDGELDKTQEKEIIEKIDSCEYCLEQYKFEKSFRNILKSGIKDIVSGKVLETIREKIKTLRK